MTIRQSGMKVALARCLAMRGSDYDVGESELNSLGYRLLYVDRNAGEAVAIFKLNTIEHPESSNALDSLGEGYQVNRERDLAIASYESALEARSFKWTCGRNVKGPAAQTLAPVINLHSWSCWSLGPSCRPRLA